MKKIRTEEKEIPSKYGEKIHYGHYKMIRDNRDEGGDEEYCGEISEEEYEKYCGENEEE